MEPFRFEPVPLGTGAPERDGRNLPAVSQTEYGHLENSVLTWSQELFRSTRSCFSFCIPTLAASKRSVEILNVHVALLWWGTLHECSAAREFHRRGRCDRVVQGWFFVSRSVDDQSTQHVMKVRIGIFRFACECVFSSLCCPTPALRSTMSVSFAVREEPHLICLLLVPHAHEVVNLDHSCHQ